MCVRQNKPLPSDADKQTYFENSLEMAQSIQEDAPERVTVIEGTTPDQIEYDPRTNTSAGQLITWVFIPLFGISALFASERQQGTLRRLLTTPSRKATFLLGTISGQVAMALIQMFLLIGFGILVMKLNWGREPIGVVRITVCGCACGGSIRHNNGNIYQDRRSSHRVEHHVRHALRHDGRMYVSA